MSLHPPSHPFIPSLTVPKTKKTAISCNSRARWPTYSHHHHHLLVPSPPPGPQVQTRLYLFVACIYVLIYVSMYVRAPPIRRTQTGLTGPLEQNRKEGRSEEGGRRPKQRTSSFPLPSSHGRAGRVFSCMQVIRPSPGVKILRLLLCHVCHVPRDHGKVYHRTDTRTHTTNNTDTVCLSACLPVSVWPVCPSSVVHLARLSVRPARARSPNKRDKIFLETWLALSFVLPLDPFCLRPPHSGPRRRRSSHVAAARIAADSHHTPQARMIVVRAPLDATVPFRADSCWVGGTP